ncbi:MAG TPA: hypothetical protein PK402_07095 [Tepidisphaeraceae bacterium]|nr:hypothetical protein [Tepidisphaeraceae bacterium]
MRIHTHIFSLLLATIVFAQPAHQLPAPIDLKQATIRHHPKLTLPEHVIGPTIPGLSQGAIPQGLAYWPKHNWFLISHYFEKASNPSVVTAIDAKTGQVVRCLTLIEAEDEPHSGHVGGLAVSDKYLWIGSEHLFRVALTAIEDAKPVDYLQLHPPIKTECAAAFVAYHNGLIWIGEFVSRGSRYESVPTHQLKDRNGVEKYAWIVGYALDADEDLKSSDNDRPQVAAILSIRQKVQGMTFLGDQIILSMSYGRKNNSTIAAYKNPLDEKHHQSVEIDGQSIPLWFLDGQNKEWEADYPPMSEGITSFGEQFGLIFESGAEKFQNGGRGPIDTILLFDSAETK